MKKRKYAREDDIKIEEDESSLVAHYTFQFEYLPIRRECQVSGAGLLSRVCHQDNFFSKFEFAQRYPFAQDNPDIENVDENGQFAKKACGQGNLKIFKMCGEVKNQNLKIVSNGGVRYAE